MSHYLSVILSFLHDLFGWPGGILLGNLVWLPVQYGAIAWRLTRHHNALHGRLDRIERHLGAGLHPEDDTP